MNKLMLALFSLYVLSACQNSPLAQNDTPEQGSSNSLYQTGNKPADLNTQLGAGYIGNGSYDRAMRKLKKALKQDPGHPLAHNYLGVLYGRLGEVKLAYKSFEKSLQLAPSDSTILNNYAIFLCEQKKFDEAQKKFKKVINNPLYNNRAGAYQSAAWCESQNENYQSAEAFYRKALKIDPTLPRTLLGMARIYYKQSNYEYAWSYFKRFYKVSILDADGLWLGINILKNMMKPDENMLSSFELQLKSKFPNSDETKWFYQGKQEY